MVAVHPLFIILVTFSFLYKPINAVFSKISDGVFNSDSLNDDASDTSFREVIKCPRNEHFSHCGARCQRNCTNVNENPEICITMCVDGCVCNTGFVRGLNGQCIKHQDCSKVKDICPPGEHFDQCFHHCQRNCSNWTDSNFTCTLDCIPGCVCNEGTVRDSSPNGRCINPEKCILEESYISDSVEKIKCPPHSHYTKCMVLCPPSCWRVNENPALCEAKCFPGCMCDHGFVRGPNQQCIRPEDCPKNTNKCPPGQRFDNCKYNCQRNCSTLNSEVICDDRCKPGCVCDEGTIRESSPDSKCVKPDECPVKSLPALAGEDFCPQNEEFSECEAHCERNCKNWKEPNVPCIRLCVPGCVCKPGFVRGPRGRCVETSRCPFKFIPGRFPKVCPRNETWSRDSGHCQKNCKTFTSTLPCLPISIPGCVCKTHWVRGPGGKCILPKECPEEAEVMEKDALFPIPRPTLPPIVCKRNETLSLCHKSCPDDCTNYQDKHRRCSTICKPSCVCASGYVRGPDGKCIKPAECPKEKKPEDCSDLEYYDTCGSACEDNCTNYNLPDKICNKLCAIGCFCKPGYVRGPKGDCIWPFDCVTSGIPSEDTSEEQLINTYELSESESQGSSESIEDNNAAQTVWNEIAWDENQEDTSTEQMVHTYDLSEIEDQASSTFNEETAGRQTLRNEIAWEEEEKGIHA